MLIIHNAEKYVNKFFIIRTEIFYALFLFSQAGDHELKLYIIVHLFVFKVAIFLSSQGHIIRKTRFRALPFWYLYHTKRLPFSAIYLATDCATWQDTDRFPSPAIKSHVSKKKHIDIRPKYDSIVFWPQCLSAPFLAGLPPQCFLKNFSGYLLFS